MLKHFLFFLFLFPIDTSIFKKKNAQETKIRCCDGGDTNDKQRGSGAR